ncbi:prepilin-type N-terminal cleavage/methylation domain-containing protein [Thalassotalea sp. LPB0316]|uniref:type II secretion system protein n=1 Tax=Thalassotalea sp. LPB0316 TaxID=2769490 RepID=UPI001868F036|nr:prepilin-type N-terminal cleavage/methylation domain-containing protein [Thalassotalea sp. LPB0316]QOL25207.1 prepilin-type N-terminal cleavage/methylation domain-containing protein [Thalassotalea sp. LPB0316]
MTTQRGFTLIELVVVIVILGILSATALPKFVDLSGDARTAALTQIKASVKAANDLIFMKSQMPSYDTQPVPGRDDLLDIDLNGDGNYDLRLKYNHLDNTDIEKRIDISDEFVVEEEGIDYTYIGYDLNQDGTVKDDQCYFSYTQAQSETIPPAYDIISDGC